MFYCKIHRHGIIVSMIAFYLLGSLPVYSFTHVLGICVLTSQAWVAWLSPGRQALHHLESGLSALPGGSIGGRLAFLIALSI